LIAPNGTSYEDAINGFEQNYEHVKRYLTEDTTGLWNLLDDAKTKGFYEENDEGMQLMIDDLDEFADQMGISTSLAEQFMFALSDMGFDVDFTSMADNFRTEV
jgi:hypothetical protein